VLNDLIARGSGTNRQFRRFVEGQPSLLVHDCKMIESHMAREHVSVDELHRALEVDGSISCLKYNEMKPDANTHLVRRRFIQNRQQWPASRLRWKGDPQQLGAFLRRM